MITKLQSLPRHRPPQLPQPDQRERGRLLVMRMRSESPGTDLVSRVKQEQPGAIDELYDLVLGIARSCVASDSSELQIQNRVDGLMTIALEAVFAGELSRPGALSGLMRTLARLPNGECLATWN